MSRYGGNPYWTTARYNGTDAHGNPVKKGTKIFYFPNGRRVFQGADAERESRAYEAAVADENFMTGGY